MELKPIRTKRDYDKALREVAPMFDKEPVPGSAAGNRFEILIMLIEAYEAKHYAISPPTPIEAIKFRMEQAGLTAKDLEPMIGRSNRVYEVLNGKRSLTLPMIRRLHSMLGIPAESLIA
jgi:HTH-type transcriptional regulator / antitoxin HigA